MKFRRRGLFFSSSFYAESLPDTTDDWPLIALTEREREARQGERERGLTTEAVSVGSCLLLSEAITSCHN